MAEQDANAPTPTPTEFTLTPAEVRAKWVAALRSSRYRRGEGRLRQTVSGRVKYCCLGVLCDVLVREGMEIEVRRGKAGVYAYGGNEATLPKSARDAAGLESAAGTLVEEVEYCHELTELNDEAEWSFRKIADLIEQGGVRTVDGTDSDGQVETEE